MRHITTARLVVALGALAASATASAAELPWAAAATLGSGTSPSGVRVADIDHDGDNDVLVTYASSDGLVGYLANSGSFTATTLYAPGTNFTTLDVADYDQSGSLDVALGSDAATWTIVSNDGAGTMTLGSTGSGGADALVSFDSDLDGDLDVYSATATGLPVQGWKGLLQHGNSGTFPASGLLMTEATEDYTDLAHGDFDRDGDQDLVYVTNLRIRVLLGTRNDATDGVNDWSNGGDLGALNGAQNLAVADIDGDNDLDIIASSNAGSGDVVVWYANDGAGSFGSAQTVLTGASDVNALHVGDPDADGDQDVLIARDSGVTIAENVGDGASWTVRTVSSSLSEVGEAVFGDVDGDGDLDIAAMSTAAGTAVWFENQVVHSTAGWASTSTDTMIGLSSSAKGAMADLDLDGDLDSLGFEDAGSAYYALDISPAQDGSLWGPKTIFIASVNQPQQVLAADLDADGDPDPITVGNLSGTPHRWFPNEFRAPGAISTAAEIITNQSTTRQVIIVDYDQDGDLDQVRGQNSGDLKVDLNGGDGTNWTTCTILNGTGTQEAVNDVGVGDIDGDGDLDIIASRNGSTDPGLRWFQHTPGVGCAAVHTEIFITSIVVGQTTSGNGGVSLADIDRDGDLDIVANADGDLVWYDNPGAPADIAGLWSETFISTETSNFNNLEDVDFDGDLDVVQASNGALRLYLNDGFGGTWDETSQSVSSASNARIYDINRDGALDAYYGAAGTYAWRSTTLQQASAVTADLTAALSVPSSPSNINGAIEEGTGGAVLGITIDHTFGRTGDVDLELGTVELFLHDGSGIALTDADAANAFDSLEVWRDNDGDGLSGGGTDVLLTDVSSFTLASGVLSLDVPTVANGGVAFGSSGDYLLVANIASTAVANGLTTLGLDHLPSEGLLIEHTGTDIPVVNDGSPAGASGVSFDVAPLDSDDDGDPDTSDCNTLNDAIYTGATELCDGIDNDCDSVTDDGFDADGDGAPNGAVPLCVTTYGAAVVDCDDGDAAVSPSATEVCDLIDNDCDGSVDEGFNVDGDAFATCGADGVSGTSDDDCNDGDASIYPGAPESCDFVDSNCDGDLVDTFTNTDGDSQPDCIDTDDDNDGAPDGGAPGVADCADTDPTIYPGAPEVCDSIDSDCDGDLVDTFTNTDGDALPDCVDLDDDADGADDACETTYGFDPLDGTDGTDDGDLDGRTNAVECTDGTDPTTYDGPDAPINTSPLVDEVVVTDAPNLIVDNATSPVGDGLTYAYEVYDDEGLTSLVASVGGVASGVGTTSWTVTTPLTDDAVIYWRAAASDAYVQGPWSATTRFTVDTVGDGPTVPEHLFPLLGQTMRAGEETLEWSDSTSPEGLDLEYDVEIWDSAALGLITSGTVVGTEEAGEEWLIDVALTVNTLYSWRVRARDPAGRTSAFSEYEVFGYETVNTPPTDSSFISPQDDAELGTVQPEFRMTRSVDTEGGAVTHRLELDTVASFDSADLLTYVPQPGSAGEVFTDLLVEGDSLAENVVWFARVSSMDIEGLSSAPDTISFFVRGDNQAPPVPELVRPAPNEITDDTPTLVVTTVADPEGDVVTYEFAVGDTRDLSGVAAVTSATREFEVSTPLAGGYYWTVRAVDSEGARSEWAEPRYAVAVDPTWGSCSAVGSASPSGWWLLLPLVGLLRRRRR